MRVPARRQKERGTALPIDREDELWLLVQLDVYGEVAAVKFGAKLLDGNERRLFERLTALAGNLGLLARGYDLEHRRQAGNVPQAFKQVTLILAAMSPGQVDAKLAAE